MEIPESILVGAGTGIAAAGGLMVAAGKILWGQVRDRIAKLEASLAAAMAQIKKMQEHDQEERTALLIDAHDRERTLARVVRRLEMCAGCPVPPADADTDKIEPPKTPRDLSQGRRPPSKALERH